MKKYYQGLWQLFLLGVLACSFVFVKNWLGFKSVLLGGSAWFIPDQYFQWKMRGVWLTFDSPKMLKKFFLNELIKLLLSFGLITLFLLLFRIDSISFLGGYILMIVVTLFGRKRFI